MNRIFASALLLLVSFGLSAQPEYLASANSLPSDYVELQTFQRVRTLNFDEVVSQMEYPELARKLGIEGTVIVNILVDENGNCLSYNIARSAGPALDRAVEEQIDKLHFAPGSYGDEPVATWTTLSFEFRL